MQREGYQSIGNQRSEISGRDLRKPFGEFETIHFLQDDIAKLLT
jgi:hypothetical protein